MYVVSQKDIRDSTPISSWKRSLILDSDEEDFEPRSKKEQKEEKLDMILSEVGGIKEALGEMITKCRQQHSHGPQAHPSRDIQVPCMSHCAHQPPSDSDKVLQDDFGVRVLHQ